MVYPSIYSNHLIACGLLILQHLFAYEFITNGKEMMLTSFPMCDAMGKFTGCWALILWLLEV